MKFDPAPLPLKILILSTVGLSLFSPFIGAPLALSLTGIQHLHLWQLITYAFVHPAPLGLTFPFLLHLAFNMFLLWTCGASLIPRMNSVPFFSLYFSAALFGGLCSLAAMALFHIPYLYAGTSAPLYAIFVAWTILNPEADFYLFFALPMKAYGILLAVFGMNLVIDLVNADWVHLFGYTGAFLYGYLFTVVAFRARSPFPFLQSLEKGLLRAAEKLRHIGKKAAVYRHSKIYDIQSGNPVLDDEQFMDAMLARISLYGEEGLSPEEKKRMQRISERKAKK